MHYKMHSTIMMMKPQQDLLMYINQLCCGCLLIPENEYFRLKRVCWKNQTFGG